MSATWDCQKHTNYQLIGSCVYCLEEEKTHFECRAELSRLKEENERYRKALKQIIDIGCSYEPHPYDENDDCPVKVAKEALDALEKEDK